jgi:dihydropteroate synthase
MNILVQRGLPENHIILDPGIGFGKDVEHNLALLQATPQLLKLGRPILLGISYKSFFGHLLGIEPEKRESITQVCTALMANQGIYHHRVHDVLTTVQSLTLQTVLQEKE